MSWEGAKVGINPWFTRHRDFEAADLSRLNQLGVVKDIGGLRNVILGHGLWIGEHAVGECSHLHQGAGFDDEEIMWLGQSALVIKGNLELLAGFDGESFFVVGQRVGGVWFENDFSDSILGVDAGDKKDQGAGGGEQIADHFYSGVGSKFACRARTRERTQNGSLCKQKNVMTKTPYIQQI